MRIAASPACPRLWRATGLQLSFAVLFFCSGASGQSTGEYQTKAAYLYNFARMTRWPAEVLPPTSHIVIGVFGGDQEFVQALRDTASGKVVNGRPIEIRHLRSPEEVKFCHVVYFRAGENGTHAAITAARSSSVLLVGEDNNFLAQGGMINLLLAEGKITYEINTAALERSGLEYGDSVSAKTKNGDRLPGIQVESPRRVTFRVAPQYPAIAASMKLIGAVQLQVTVKPDGAVKQVHVLGGHPVLAQAAVEALKQWKYQPTPKETTESVRISFGP
jgi:TonB family protein